MSTDGGLTWPQVKRRRLWYFSAALVALGVGLAVISVAPRWVDDLPRALAVALPFLCFAPFFVLGLGTIRTRTAAGRHAIRTGQVLPGAAGDDLREELRAARVLSTQGVLVAVAIVVLVPVGAASAFVGGTAVVGVLSWTTGLLLAALVVVATWGVWQRRRRRRLTRALLALDES